MSIYSGYIFWSHMMEISKMEVKFQQKSYLSNSVKCNNQHFLGLVSFEDFLHQPSEGVPPGRSTGLWKSTDLPAISGYPKRILWKFNFLHS